MRENLSGGITVNTLGLHLLSGNVVLSLRPGGMMPLLVG